MDQLLGEMLLSRANNHAAANAKDANNSADVHLQSLCVAQYVLISFKHMGEMPADEKFDNLDKLHVKLHGK